MVRPMNLPAPAGRTTFTLTQKIRLAEYASELKQQRMPKTRYSNQISNAISIHEPPIEKLNLTTGVQSMDTTIKQPQ